MDYIEGSQVIIPPPPPQKKNVFIILKINFALANLADSCGMPLYGAFHLGLHCLSKYLFKGSWSTKGFVYMPRSNLDLSCKHINPLSTSVVC